MIWQPRPAGGATHRLVAVVAARGERRHAHLLLRVRVRAVSELLDEHLRAEPVGPGAGASRAAGRRRRHQLAHRGDVAPRPAGAAGRRAGRRRFAVLVRRHARRPLARPRADHRGRVRLRARPERVEEAADARRRPERGGGDGGGARRHADGRRGARVIAGLLPLAEEVAETGRAGARAEPLVDEVRSSRSAPGAPDGQVRRVDAGGGDVAGHAGRRVVVRVEERHRERAQVLQRRETTRMERCTTEHDGTWGNDAPRNMMEHDRTWRDMEWHRERAQSLKRRTQGGWNDVPRNMTERDRIRWYTTEYNGTWWNVTENGWTQHNINN